MTPDTYQNCPLWRIYHIPHRSAAPTPPCFIGDSDSLRISLYYFTPYYGSVRYNLHGYIKVISTHQHLLLYGSG